MFRNLLKFVNDFACVHCSIRWKLSEWTIMSIQFQSNDLRAVDQRPNDPSDDSEALLVAEITPAMRPYSQIFLCDPLPSKDWANASHPVFEKAHALTSTSLSLYLSLFVACTAEDKKLVSNAMSAKSDCPVELIDVDHSRRKDKKLG